MYTQTIDQRILGKIGKVIADEAAEVGADTLTAAVNFAYSIGLVGPARLAIVRAAEAAVVVALPPPAADGRGCLVSITPADLVAAVPPWWWLFVGLPALAMMLSALDTRL